MLAFKLYYCLLLVATFDLSVAQSLDDLGPVVGPSWTVSPFHPHAIPLAVRSPYLHSWIAGGNGSAPLSAQYPLLRDMKRTLGWSLIVKVDAVAYRVMGGDDASFGGAQVANQTDFSFTATQTKFTHSAGDMNITTSFISPVEPSNLTLQSLPAAYITVSVQSNDGNRHSVKVYSDISAEWITGDKGRTAVWDTVINTSSIMHYVHQQGPQKFTVVNNQIQDATAYYGIVSGDQITWRTGAAGPCRNQFISQGFLLNTKDPNFRPVLQNLPTQALSIDLGSIATSSAPVVFALGLIRDPAISSRSAKVNGKAEERSLYFFTQFSSAFEAMDYFISDFARAESESSKFDKTVRSAASAVSNDYADLIDLSVRQVFAMVEITAGKDSEGNWDLNDVQAFMDDDIGLVTTVDILYPAFPMFLQTNPVIAGALLKPLLLFQEGNRSPNLWAAHDLGTQYPIAGGDFNNREMPVEESANMLIMTLAQARASGDATLVANHYDILDQWAQYLVSNAMNAGDQNFTDSFLTGPVVNDTNLALKGIIGIQAMAGIATAANNSAAARKYSTIASGLLAQWQSLAFSTDQSRILLGFGNDSSSLGLLYNLYADKLLGLNMIPQKVYDQATMAVKTQMQYFGVAMDSRSPTASKTDWAIFTAAALSDPDAQNALISSVRKYAGNLLSRPVPFSDYYDVAKGTSIGFQARPVQGAMYAILALQTLPKPITLPPPQTSATAPPSPSNTPKDSAPSVRASSLLMVTVLLAMLASQNL